MLPFQGYHGLHQQHQSMVNVMDGGDSTLTSSSKSTEACKSHKEAERRRRQRINSHLSTLRSLLPSTTKTDKASLLAEVVQHIRELKARAAEAVEAESFPGESDEAKLTSYCRDSDGDREAKMVSVSVCCEDRPGLNRELSHAIRSVRARTVRAEMMTVGGRTRSVVVMEWADGSGGEEDVEALESALKATVENRTSGSGLGHMVRGNKRARVFGLVQ